MTAPLPPESPDPRPVSPLTGRERRRLVAGLSVCLLLILLLAYWLRIVVGPLLLALCFAYILEPVVQRLMAWRFPRFLAVAAVFLAFLAVTGVGIWLLVRGSMDLYQAAFLGAEGRPDSRGFLFALPDLALGFYHEQIETYLRQAWRAEVGAWLEDLFDPKRLIPLLEKVPVLLSGLGSGVSGFFDLVSILVLLPIYLFYLMLDYPRVLSWVERHLPGRHRPRILRTARRIHEGLAAFLRGRILIAIFKGLLLAFGLWLCGVPFPFVVGLLSGLLSILPFLGAALGLIAAVILALAYQTGGIGVLGGIALVFLAAEAVEGYVLFPWILGDKLDMHPITMLFSVLAWGAIFGFFGVLVAIPLTIIAKILFQDFVLPPIERLAAEGREGA